MTFPGWLDFEIGENSIGEYILVFLCLVFLLLLRRFFSVVLSRIIYKLITKKGHSDAVQTFIVLLSKPLQWLITLLVIYFSIIQLDIPTAWGLVNADKPGLLMILERVFEISLIVSITFFCLRLIDYFAQEWMEKHESNSDKMIDKQLFPFLKELVKIFLVIVSFFFGLGFVFELNIGNIIAGLGLGGLAFALAAKESLENLFASFTIFLDKPFVVGDLVTVNGITGSIEKVGFRSTRIRTLEKSFVTLPNKMLIDNPLDNLTQRSFRRADFRLTLEYGTSKESMESFMIQIRDLLDNHPFCNKEERLVRFTEFGDYAYIIRVLFFIQTPDFVEFMKIREEINLQIFDLARGSKVSLAYPTQTLKGSQSDIQQDS
jgi:MscS family membrane protein